MSTPPDWLERRRVGEIGEGPLAESTYEDYLWRPKKYILPTFGRTSVARISNVDCRRFRGKLFKDSEALKKIAAAGGRAEDEKGRLRRPLSPRSIQMMMRLLGQILAQAVKDKVRDDNPARDPDLKIKVPSPHGPSLRSISSWCCWTRRIIYRPRPGRASARSSHESRRRRSGLA